jgi:hypothetical protein
VLPVIAIFLALSILPVWYNLSVWRRYQGRKGLHERGLRAVATITEVGSTMGALAVSSTLVRFAFDVDHAGASRRFEVRVVATGGLERPQKGDLIDIVYLPDNPKVADFVGNPGNFRTFTAPLIGLNLLWLAALFAVVVELVERSG